MNIYQKLTELQVRLKAPKGQFNSFGKYNYRSMEDITEAVKPLLSEFGLCMTVSDEPMVVGDRVYIKATATLVNNNDASEIIVNTASAREALSKKGMDEAQITGSASSYARKYCLNGLFNIDDNKDPDTDAQHNQTNQAQLKQQAQPQWAMSFNAREGLKAELSKMGITLTTALRQQWNINPKTTDKESLEILKQIKLNVAQQATGATNES